jgi:hypothetical protein
VGADVQGFADDLFRVATNRATEIDGLIEGHAQHWRMERMAAVDRNLMRAAVARAQIGSDKQRRQAGFKRKRSARREARKCGEGVQVSNSRLSRQGIRLRTCIMGTHPDTIC